MSHTPGPWRFLPGLTNHNIWKADLILARVFKFEKDLETSDANARLMAAAPELLEVCKELLDWGLDHISPVHNPEANVILIKAVTVINKATGEQL